jgi:seryl-tRNA synthetase
VLDLALIREKPEFIKAEIAKLNSEAPIDQIVELDQQRRSLLTKVEALRQQRNTVSKEIGRMKDQAARQAKIAEMRQVGDRIGELDEQLRQVETELERATLWVPNLPHASVPIGPDEGHNVVVRQEGQPGAFDFEPLAHWDLGPMLGIIDFERGVKLSGSRFYLLRGLGARLQRALITWMLDLHIHQHDYTEMYLPYMVRGEVLVGAAQLPKFAENIYHDAEEDFWWIGTAEIPLTNVHRDEILDGADLPLKYVAYSACFRREKMSAGRDVRGIKRGHQFDKVEMYKFTTPETSYDELEELVHDAEDVCRALEIPYRVVQMCSGDLGFQASKKYDLELWAPGCEEWLEVSSVSNCEDFQARRANVRFRREKGARSEFVHTLNGSGLALPRTMIAIVENYQQADGSVVVPEALRPYMGGIEVIRFQDSPNDPEPPTQTAPPHP